MRAARRLLLGLAVASCWVLPAAAAPPPPKADVHLCGDRTIFLRARHGGGLWLQPGPDEHYRVTVFEVPKDPLTAVTETMAGREIVREVGAVTGEWIHLGILLRAVLPRSLTGGRDYVVHLDLVARGAVAGGAERPVAVAEFSTRALALVVPSLASAEAGSTIELFSQTPLKNLPNEVEVTEVVTPAGLQPVPGGGARAVPEAVRRHRACRAGGGAGCVPSGPSGASATSMEARDTQDDGACEEPALSGSSPTGFSASDGAIFHLRPGDRLRRGSRELRLGPLLDVFGQEVQAKGAVPPPPVPKGKNDAEFYLAAQLESSEGAPDTLALDLKIRPSFYLRGPWLYQPELTASLARNLPKASDSVHLASLLTRAFRGDSRLGDGIVSIGPSLEADRDLDRINVLLDLRWKPGLVGLDESRDEQRKRLAIREGLPAETVLLPDWGWGLGGWVGIEAGGSVAAQTAEGGAGKDDLKVPDYEILRVRAQVQAFVEYRRLSLTVASGLRYLATDEPVVRKDDDGDWVLVELDQGRPYTEATLALALDRTRNIALALTFKEGSEPPLYRPVDKVSLGLVARY